MRLHSIPSSRSSIKILNRTGPSTNPWGTPLVTGHHLDVTPFTTDLWAWPSSQFFTQQRVYLSKPWAASFITQLTPFKWDGLCGWRSSPPTPTVHLKPPQGRSWWAEVLQLQGGYSFTRCRCHHLHCRSPSMYLGIHCSLQIALCSRQTDLQNTDCRVTWN